MCCIKEFKLFITPPKKILTDLDETIYKCGLSPASLLYFSSENEDEIKFSEECLSVLEEHPNLIKVEKKEEVKEDMIPHYEIQSKPNDFQIKETEIEKSEQTVKKVPKWFKPSK